MFTIGDRENREIIKIQEAPISYEQILLLQISRCAGAKAQDLPLCVTNLISLLPTDILKEYNTLYSKITHFVISQIKDLGLDCCEEFEEEGFCLCDGKVASELTARISKALREDPELSIFEHAINSYAFILLRPKDELVISIARSQLKFAIVTRLLIESGLLGFKTTHVHIGRVTE